VFTPQNDRAIAQAVSCLPLSMTPMFDTKAMNVGFVVDIERVGKDFVPLLRFSLVIIPQRLYSLI
jgi:hypothetical protein